MEFELNIFDPDIRANPYPLYERMREIGPVTRNPMMMGAYTVVEYDSVGSILRNPAVFSSDRPDAGAFGAPIMLNTDPPDHTRLRGVVSRAFTPRALADLEQRVHAIADELMSPLVPGTKFDVVANLSYPLPVIVIAELLGVASEDRDRFKQWSNALIASSNEMADSEQQVRGAEGAANLRAYFAEEIAKRRTNPSDDLIGLMVRANEGEVLTDAEMLAACVLLLVAGNETTTSLITNATLAFARDPQLWSRLVEAPELIPEAVEEALRYDGPIQMTIRTALSDVELGGVDIKAGSLVLAMLAAANRDPSHFDDPTQFRLDRKPNAHVAFGNGIHFCLGSSLARLEARVAIEHLAARAPSLALAYPDTDIEYGPSFIFHAPSALEIVAS